jgi:hypothetical protein
MAVREGLRGGGKRDLAARQTDQPAQRGRLLDRVAATLQQRLRRLPRGVATRHYWPMQTLVTQQLYQASGIH